MTRQHKDLASGPPRGPGHHSEDGRQWWDDRHQCWFPVTDLEDYGGADGDRPGVATGGGRGATDSGGGADRRRAGRG